jgi:acetolactate synthase-1/2/3 large subunit
MVRKAFKAAETPRPSACYLAIPEDVEQLPVDADLKPLPVNIVREDAPSPSQIKRAASVLQAAKAPIILAGHGAARSNARDALVRFSEHL